ncbi:MAG: UDP-N-acetylmuramoyl-L-alanine--D-glutamate ligase [Alteromonadaceae bacterium]|nr:UDP-N-acetylmuramoyl-L-alanine--D-glutamate ligase [Alteromonadaceae bacterium]
MNILQLKNKNIVVLGAGLTGISCVRFLHKHGLSFAVNDSRASLVIHVDDKVINESEFNQLFPNVQLVLGCWDTELINKADLLIVSPGIDLHETRIDQMINPDCEVVGDVELYCQLNNQTQSPTKILAVTGSNGKSTVVALLETLALALGVRADLGGNIGVPVLDNLSENLTQDEKAELKPVLKPELLILELSSFQLENLRSMSALAATVLNISDDHLDRHKTLANYQTIKHGIYQQCEVAVVNRDDPLTLFDQTELKEKRTSVVKRIISFGSDKPENGHFGLECINQQTYLMFGEKALIPLAELPLTGIHNALNYMAVLALGLSANWSLEGMVSKLADFKGLLHRCQRVESTDDIQWINDSKATNVGATLAAINGMSASLHENNKIILIAGGDGKGADFSPLAEVIDAKVSYLITLGKDGRLISKLCEHCDSVERITAESLEEAVLRAQQFADAGDIVLLSPACASIDMFINFAQRGEAFTSAVDNLQKEKACQQLLTL